MLDPIDAIVQILAPDGTVGGTGFVVGPDLGIVTCAHVLTAINWAPLLPVQARLFRTGRMLKCWVADDKLTEVQKEDVAFLTIEITPKEERPSHVELGSSFIDFARDTHTFGFPPYRAQEGAHARCEIIGHVPEGGFDALQVRRGEVTYGFSGAPVWDTSTGFVIGMVVSIVPPGADAGQILTGTSFIRTIEVIRIVCGLRLGDGQPYLGLTSFDASIPQFYFGRDKEIGQLVDLIRVQNAILVTGVSGSGKSSLVQAGLAKGLQHYAAPGLPVDFALFQPTLTPIISCLSVVAQKHSISFKPGTFSVPQDTSSPRAWTITDEKSVDLAVASSELGSELRNRQCALVVDQFERLFTDCPDVDAQKQFVSFLGLVATSGAKIIIALRLDYTEIATQYRFLHDLNSATISLGPLSKSALRDAVVKPAELLGRVVEDAATEALIEDVRGRPGDLPLLQFALLELWTRDNQTGVLSFETYKSLGYDTPAEKVTGAQGAIIKRAEEEWRSLEKTSEAKDRDRLFLKVFLKLVQVPSSSSSGALPGSRRAWLAEFDQDARICIESLAKSFLITTGIDPISGQPTAEVAHETLIRHWPRIRISLDHNRAWVNWYANQFGYDFRRWLLSGDKRALLVGEQLETAAKWYREEGPLLDGPPTLYIEEAQKRKNIDRVVAYVAVVILCLIGLGFYGENRRETNERAAELHERGVTALSSHDYASAEVLLAAALSLSDSVEVRQHLLDSRVSGNQLIDVQKTAGPSLGVSPNGKWALLKREAQNKDGSKHSWLELYNFETNTSNQLSLDQASSNYVSAGTATYAVSDRGTVAFGGTDDGAIYLRNVSPDEGSADVNIPDQTAGGINSIAFSGDGSHFAVGRWSGQVELRETGTGHLKSSVQAHRLSVHTLAFSPTKLMVVSGGADRMVKIWDCSTGTVRSVGAHEDFVNAVAFSPDGSLVVSGGAEGLVRVWNPSRIDPKNPDAALLHTFAGHLGNVTAVAVANDGMALSASEDGTVRLWNAFAGGEIAQFRVTKDVADVVLRDTSHSFSAIDQGRIYTWDLATRQEGFTLFNLEPVLTVAIAPDGNTIAAGGQDGKITLWDIASHQQTHTPLAIPDGRITSLLFTRDGSLLSGSEDGIFRRWNLSSGASNEFTFTADFQGKKTPTVWAIAVDPMTNVAAFGTEAAGDSRIYLVDLHTWKKITSIRMAHTKGSPGPGTPIQSVWSLSFNSAGKLLVSANGDGTVSSWDITDLKHPEAIKGKAQVGAEMWGTRFLNGGNALATAGLDRKVRLWELPDFKPLDSLPVRSNHQWTLNLLRSMQSSGWDWYPDESMNFPIEAARKLIGTDALSFGASSAHRGLIQSMASGRNEDWLATASVDHTVKLWNLKTRQVITLSGHYGPVWWVVFGPDGNTFVSGGLDRRIVVRHLDQVTRVFEASPRELLDDARKDTCSSLDAHGELTYPECAGNVHRSH